VGANTKISWTDRTFNPWWGCTRVSPACDHCYAETFSKRVGHDLWGKDAPRRFFGAKHWAEPLRWDRQAAEDGRRHRVFCASMADVFETRRDVDAQLALDDERYQLWALILRTPNLDWQLLTKRPENVRWLVPHTWMEGEWPANVWIGTTVEDQIRARLRVPRLLAIPAPIRFLSCEPLLGPVDLVAAVDPLELGHGWATITSGISWVICGGESGPGHRPLNLDHARDIRDQCMSAGVPFFFKQVGGRTPTAGGDQLDGVTYKEFPESAHA
jgi:protein gp37